MTETSTTTAGEGLAWMQRQARQEAEARELHGAAAARLMREMNEQLARQAAEFEKRHQEVRERIGRGARRTEGGVA